MPQVNVTSENTSDTSHKKQKIDYKDVIRKLLREYQEMSWKDLETATGIKSTSKLSSTLRTLRANGEISKGKCSEDHKEQRLHDTCRSCYFLFSGGDSALRYVMKKLDDRNLKDPQIQSYLEIAVGLGPYDLSKLHSYNSVVKLLKVLIGLTEAGMPVDEIYHKIASILSIIKLTKAEKRKIGELMTSVYNKVLDKFGTGNHGFANLENLVASMISVQLVLGTVSFYSHIVELMMKQKNRSTGYKDKVMKYAPIQNVITLIVKRSNELSLPTDLKQHQTDLIDMYALGEPEEKAFLRFLIKVSEKISLKK